MITDVFKYILITVFSAYVFSASGQNSADTAATEKKYVQGGTADQNYLVINDHMRLKGLVQGGYFWNSIDEVQSSLYLRRVRLDLSGDIIPKFSYRVQLELLNTPRLLNAEVNYAADPLLNIHFGLSKTPYCYDNMYNPYTLPTISRTMLDENLSGRILDLYGNQVGRDIGVWVTGKWSPIANRDFITYVLGIYNGAGLALIDNNNEKDISGALRISPVKDLWISGRFYNGTGITVKYPEVPTDRKRVGGDITFTHKQLLIEGEYLFGKDVSDSLGVIGRSGWNVTGGYFIIPEKLQVVFRFDTFLNDIYLNAIDQYRYVAAASWFFTKTSRIQMEYDYTTPDNGQTYFSTINILLLAGF